MGVRIRKHKGNESETWTEDRNKEKWCKCQCMGIKKHDVDTDKNSEHQVVYLGIKTEIVELDDIRK
jgi:hypothetical protein